MSKIERQFNFRKTKENGGIGGTTQSCLVPEFDWNEFKNLPNAELFARRAYNSVVQKLVRDILLSKNGTTEQHLQSIESVLARTFTFTRKEIEEWCISRDWESTTLRNPEKAIQILTEKLPDFATDDNAITDEASRNRIAEIIADVADRKSDDIAEYLWVKLTQKTYQTELLSL